MKLPIISYGDPILKRKGETIDKDYPGLEQLIADMFETMYAANGVGLAAPQIGRSIRLFVFDASPYKEDEPGLSDFKKVFINAELLDEEGYKWLFNEWCIIYTDVRADIICNYT